MSAAPEGSNLGLGCGNPQAIDALKPAETLLDLGSGAGFDAFRAFRAVGPTGRVIGADMTPEMVSKARKNKADRAYANVEFRIGEIENLPVTDATIRTKKRRQRNRLRQGDREVVENAPVGAGALTLLLSVVRPLCQGLPGPRMLLPAETEQIVGADFAGQSKPFHARPPPLARCEPPLRLHLVYHVRIRIHSAHAGGVSSR